MNDSILNRSDHAHRQWVSGYRSDAAHKASQRIMARALQKAGLKPGAHILDAGCGTGKNSDWLNRAGYKVTGIDFSAFALAHASNELGDRIEFRWGDLTKLDVPDESFDAVLLMGVLMHIPDVVAAIGEVVRVTKPGGALLVSEANKDALEIKVRRALQSRKMEPHPSGLYEWATTPDGPYLCRKMDLEWLAKRMGELGAPLVWRGTGNFTELFTRFSAPAMKRLFFFANALWFKLRAPASMALGNVLVFRKH